MEKRIIEWNAELSVGNKKLDDEHKGLFDKINDLYFGFKNGKDETIIRSILVFLDRYINEHFNDEEEYMRKNQFPGLITHKRVHQEFMKKYEEFKKRYSSGYSAKKLKEEVKSFLAEWWINHVAMIDHQYADYITPKH